MAFEHQRKLIAGGLFVVAFVCVGITAMTLWNAWTRWQVVGDLERAADSAFDGKIERSERAAGRAAERMPDAADAVLPATDPDLESSIAELEALSRRVSPQERRRVDTALQFVRAIHGRDITPGAMGGSDASFIQYLLDLQATSSGQMPAAPTPSAGQPPVAAIVHRVLEERVATAWRIADADAATSSAIALRFFDPDHPAVAALGFVGQSLGRGATKHDIERSARPLSAAERRSLARGVIRILEADRGLDDASYQALIDLIPAEERSPEEVTRLMRIQDVDLPQLVDRVAKSGSQTLVASTINRCAAAGRLDLVPPLAAKLPAEQRDEVLLAVAVQQWDIEAIRRLADDPEAYLPSITPPVRSGGHLGFHLVTGGGAPSRTPTIRIDRQAVPPERLQRVGTALSVPVPDEAAAVHLSVALGDYQLFEGTVQR